MAQLTQVYALRADREEIAAVQRATLETEDFGLVPEPWLFGSAEWWQDITDGITPVHTVSGTISRVFMSGHNDYPEFEIDDGTTKSCWTQQTSDVPGSTLSRQQMADLYREGASVRVSYVKQRFKKPVPGLGTESKCVVAIWVEHAA